MTQRVLLCVALATAALLAHAQAEPAKPVHAVFFNNSMTWFNAMPKALEELAAAGDPAVDLRCAPVVSSMQTLRGHWEGGGSRYLDYRGTSVQWLRSDVATLADDYAAQVTAAEKALAKEGNPVAKRHAEVALHFQRRLAEAAKAGCPWNYALLGLYANDDAVDDETVVRVRLMANIARRRGAVPVVYFPGGFQKATIENDRAAKEQMAKSVRLATAAGVLVVPAQYAANKAWRAKPDLVLHSKYLLSDIHPGPRGSYLIACLVYATLFDRSPVGLPALTMHNERYSAANNEPSVTLTAEEARACQDAAWATYQDFKVAVAAAKDPYAVKTPLALVIGMPSAGGGSPLRDPMRALPGRATLFTPGGDSTVARALADADDYLGKESWKTVVLSLGHADAIAKTPEADYVRDLTALVKRLKATGATLVWLGAFPHPSKDPQAVTLEALQSYNAAARKVLEAEGVTIAELYDVAVTDAKAAEPKKMNADVDAAWKIIGMAAVECLKTPTRGVN